MPAFNAHTVTVWCRFTYRPRRDADGWLMMPTDYPDKGIPAEGERLIDTLRDLWATASRPNCNKGFRPSEVQTHINGWGSFTVAFIEHEGDGPVVERLKEEVFTWRYDDGSAPIRLTHTNYGDLEGEWDLPDSPLS